MTTLEQVIPMSPPGGGGQPRVATITTSQLWENPGVEFAYVRGIGGGAGGGGAQTFANSLNAVAGGGGGAGQWCDWEPVFVNFLDVFVTIGQGGPGGSGGLPPTGDILQQAAEAGANGGDTLFGALLTLRGGQGGEGRDSVAARPPAAVDCGSLGGASSLSNTGILPTAGNGGGIVSTGLSPHNTTVPIKNAGYNFYGLPSLLSSSGICDRGWPGAGGRATSFDLRMGYGGRSGVVDIKTAADGGDAEGFGCGGGGAICYDNNTVVGNGGAGSPGWLQVLWYE